MKTQILKNIGTVMALSAVVILTGCSSKTLDEKKVATQVVEECVISGEIAPSWACGTSTTEGSFTSVGSANKSKLGHGYTNREALANARSSLAQQIETEVKDKVESFMRSTGVQEAEVADKVTSQVSKQVAKVTLQGSKQVKYWENPKDNSIYVLVAIDQNTINQKAKDSVRSSFKNDNALWQQFQSKQALKNLEKEFPTN